MYYVYCHKDVASKAIFYIGKGKGKQAFSKSRRNKNWEIKASKGFEVEILKYFTDEKEALDYELFLIKTLPDLVNIRTENTIKSIPSEISEYISYSEESPSGLIWIKPTNRAFTSGHIAGIKCYRNRTIPTNWIVMFKGKRYTAHRIVLLLNNIDIPDGYVVNHIDCNPHNNLISNLEVCTTYENNNRSSVKLGLRLNSRNTSGVVGVRETLLVKRSKTYYFAHACITFNGKTINKKFAYGKHGKERAWELAIQWRKNMYDIKEK